MEIILNTAFNRISIEYVYKADLKENYFYLAEI